ncbi:MAG TPA: hypothetical protein EYP35_05285 [Desulfobacterales bacterium]|nr:hypothetical protein [Desulfobacterales bacterium]HIP38341.1 hypothetical protein [Desulfocapsa sulfexigens]
MKAYIQTDVQSAFCNACSCNHTLPRAPAIDAAQKLMTRMDQELDVAYLNSKALGKMFGVLVCRTQKGEAKTLKAFSGQYNGEWEKKGWVPPLFDVKKFHSLNDPVEKQIKKLGRESERTTEGTAKYIDILQTRKKLSQQLMKDIHAMYTLHNFRGQQRSLSDLFPEGNGIPTGTGDCCAPKLLNFAATHDLQPIGLAEFYWGLTNKSATRQEGHFYSACKDKCGPILGFLLCGIETGNKLA